ncbi:MAG: hypothetical protein NVS1B14_04470 [Vulcanimicrobiaceae bacterium]
MVFTFDREGGDVEFAQRRGHIILRGERVAGTQGDLGASRLQSQHQVRRLRGYMQTRADANPGKRFGAREPLFDLRENRQVGRGPRNTSAALFGKGTVFDIAPDRFNNWQN